MANNGQIGLSLSYPNKNRPVKAIKRCCPDAFVKLSEIDAAEYGIAEGDMVEVESRRGKVVEPAKIGGIEPGLVFIPFHYGYWDDDERLRAANELTLTQWHPVNKQPQYKYGAVRISKAGEGVLHNIGKAIDAIKEKLKPQEA